MIGDQIAAETCSRAECQATAEWAIEWRNPKIHSTDRIKTWLACTEHAEYLRSFLRARNFPVRQVQLNEVGTLGPILITQSE